MAVISGIGNVFLTILKWILKIVLEVIDKVAVKPYNSSIKSNEGQIRYY